MGDIVAEFLKGYLTNQVWGSLWQLAKIITYYQT